MEKMAWWPKWGWEVLSPANPDLVDILGDMDLAFEDFRVFDMFFAFQISGIPGFQISKIWPGAGLGLGINGCPLAQGRYGLRKIGPWMQGAPLDADDGCLSHLALEPGLTTEDHSYSGFCNYIHPHGLQRGVDPGCQTGWE